MISVLYMIVILVYENELSNATLKHRFIEMCQFYLCLLKSNTPRQESHETYQYRYIMFIKAQHTKTSSSIMLKKDFFSSITEPGCF